MEDNFFSQEAETAVLGCLMTDNSTWDAILTVVGPPHFHFRKNILIFEAIESVLNTYNACDLIMVRDELARRGRLDLIGGAEEIAAIINQAPDIKNAEIYAKIVLECWRRRKIKSVAEEIITHTSSPMKTDELIITAEKKIYDAARVRHERELISVSDFIQQVNFDPGNYIKTGFTGIDDKIYGLGEGDMVVVAGRPASGKSALCVNIAANITSRGIPVGIFSLEMTHLQLQQRLICAKAKVNLADALQGKLTLKHEEDIARAKEWLTEYPLFIDDNPILTPEILRRKVLRMVNRHGIRAVIVDYLQLMRSSQFSSLHEKVTAISQSIKAIALEFNIPVIVLAQLNRKPEEREDGQPKVSDLRDSGSIEQDADVVILIHRLDFYSETNTGESHIIIGKNRRGETGTVPVTYLGNYTLFIEPQSI